MSAPLWRQILEGTYSPLPSLDRYGLGAGRPAPGLRADDQTTIDWRQFQLDESAARDNEREQERIERELLEEMGQEYVNLAQAQSRLGLTAERALAFGEDTDAPPQRTALEGVGRVLDLPKSFVVGTVSGLLGWDRAPDQDIVTEYGLTIPGRRSEDLATGRNNFAVAMDRALNVLFHGESYGFGDFGVLRYESEETRRAERVALGAAAFILDTAFDPLTYVSFGSSIFGRAIASQGVRRATQKVANEALEGASEQFLRSQVSALPKGLLARRAGAIVGEDSGRLMLRSADELTDIIARDRKLFSQLAGDAWATGNAAAYASMGRTGLYDRMVATIGRENADKYFRMLPEDIQGGLRWRVPFVRTASEETGLRMPTIVRFPFSYPGYGFDVIGMGAVTRRVNQFRLDRRTGLFKPVENIQGRYGKSGWTEVLQAARRGDAEAIAAYTEWFSSMVLDIELKKFFAAFDKIADSGIRRAAQKLRTFTGNQDEVAALAGDIYFKRGRPDGMIDADTPDKLLAQDIANEMFKVTDRLHDMMVELYGAEAAMKMQNYATRMLTKEGLEEISQRYGYMFARPTRVVDTAAGRRYSSFPKRMDVDKDGKLVVLEWYTPSEITEKFGRELFIDDPILAVGAYSHMMRRELGRDWTLRYMQDNGMLMPLAEDVITKPTMTRIMSEAKSRIHRVRRARKALEVGENAEDVTGALLEAERLGREAAGRLARMNEVESNVFRSEDGLVQVSRNRDGTWSATVGDEPVLPQTGRPFQDRIDVPFDAGPDPDWDKLRALGGRGYRQQLPGTTQTDETVRAAGGVPVGEPVPTAPAAPDRVPSARLRPYLESGQDADLELIHQTLRREASGARRVSRARQQQAEKDLELLESLHPSLRNREYPDFVTPPPASALPETPVAPMAREAADAGTLKPVRAGEARLTFRDGTEAQITRRVDPDNPALGQMWFAEYNGRDLGKHTSRAKAVQAIRDSRGTVRSTDLDIPASRNAEDIDALIRIADSAKEPVDDAINNIASYHLALIRRYSEGDMSELLQGYLYVDVRAIEQAALEARNPAVMRRLYNQLIEAYQVLGEFDGIYPPLLSQVRSQSFQYMPNTGPLNDSQISLARRLREAWKKRDRQFNNLVRTVDELADENARYAVEVLEELFNAAKSQEARSLSLTLSYRTELRALSTRVEPPRRPIAGARQVENPLEIADQRITEQGLFAGAAPEPAVARRPAETRRRAQERDVDPDLDFEEVIPVSAEGEWEGGLFYAGKGAGREVRIAPEITEPSPRALDADPASGIVSGPFKGDVYMGYAMGRNYTARPEPDGSYTILRRKTIKAKDEEVGRIANLEEYENFIISDARAFAAQQGLDDPFRRVFLEPYMVDGEEQFFGAYGNITYRIFKSGDTYFTGSSENAKDFVGHGTFKNFSEAVDAIAVRVRTDPPKLSAGRMGGLFDAPEAAVTPPAAPAARAAVEIDEGYASWIRQLVDGDTITDPGQINPDRPIGPVGQADAEAGRRRFFHGLASEDDVTSVTSEGIRPYAADEFGGAGVYGGDLSVALEYGGRLSIGREGRSAARQAQRPIRIVVAEVSADRSRFVADDIAGFDRIDGAVSPQEIAAVHVFEFVPLETGVQPARLVYSYTTGDGELGSFLTDLGVAGAPPRRAVQPAPAATVTPAAAAAPSPEDALRSALRELAEVDDAVNADIEALVRGASKLSLDEVEGIEDELINRIVVAARILATEDADLARRIVSESFNDITVRAAVSDEIERAAQLAAQPPVGGTSAQAFRGFNSRWEAEYAANRIADKTRAPQARVVRDEVFETNRQEMIAKLNEDETWLSALLDPENLQQFPEEELGEFIDRITSLVNAVDPSIRPMQDIVDKTRYAQALTEAGYRGLSQDGLNNRVTNIIMEQGLFGTNQTAAILRRHFALQNDLDEAQKFYAAVWRPYYTSMKAWMTMGRGYGYTARNMIGSMYNAWLADVQLRHFKESAAMIAARRSAREAADQEIIARRTLPQEMTEEIWDDIFYKKFEEALTSKSGIFGGYSKARANFLIRSYRAFTDNDFGGRAAGGRVRGEILDSSRYDPTFYGPVPGYESSRLYPGRTTRELTAGQRVMEASVNNAWMRHVTRVNEGMEDYLRFAAFMRGTDIYGLDDGGLAAGLFVRGTQFDYADLSSFERKVMKNIVPFYTWTRYNVPLQIRSVWMEPGKVNRLLRFHEEVLKAWTGEDREKEGDLPEWLRRRGGWMTTMTTPLSDPETRLGQIFGFKEDPIAAFIESPLSDLGMLFNATINPLQLMNMDEVVNNLNPLLGKTFYEALTGRSYTSGRELRAEAPEPPRWSALVPGLRSTTPEGDRVYDERIANTLRNLAPPFAQIERLLAPIAGDERMRRRWTTTLGSQLAAVPLYTVDPNQQAFAMNQRSERLNEQLRQVIPGYRDERRDFANALIQRGIGAEDIQRLQLQRPDVNIADFNIEELDRILRQQRQDEQLERFMEGMTERQQEAFIGRRGYRGRSGREAVELWRQRGSVDPLEGVYAPRVADAFEAWFQTLTEWEKTRAVYQYGFGPYRGRQAVQNWREQGGFPNVPAGRSPDEFLP